MPLDLEHETTLPDPRVPPPRSRGEAASAGAGRGSSSREPGTLLAGRYRLEGRIGAGGMGEVHRAFDVVLGERVAVKLLAPSLASEPDVARRVRAEVTLARRVSHPNVCRVHDVGEADGALFVTMELIEGEDLASLLRRIGRLPGEKALEVARQVTAGVAAAHAAGVLHRDLKPANVMFDVQGRARLTDFGLAVAGAPAKGDVSGTPAYMAPELLAGGSASVRSDLYALGLLLYELFTGKKPVEAASLSELRERRLASEPVPISRLVAEVPPGAERAILVCLAVDPAARPATALEVLAGLTGGDAVGAALLAGQTPSPAAVASSGPVGVLRPAIAWGLVAAIAVAIGCGWALYNLGTGVKLTMVDLDGLPHPPAVLAVKARETVAAFGLAVSPGREEQRFLYAPSVARWASQGARQERWRRIFEDGRPAPIRFLFRRGVPPETTANPWGVPRVSEPVPPLPPHAVAVTLDSRGRLLGLVAGPDLAAPGVSGSTDEAAAIAMRLAGLDPASLSPAEPSQVPPVFADLQRAWNGRVPGREDLDLRLELATLRGQPVYVSVTCVPEERGTAARAGGGPSLNQFVVVFELGLLVAALVLAARNLRAGRGDLPGALRVAGLLFGLELVVQVLRWPMPGSAMEIGLQLAWRVGISLYEAVVLAVFYLAVEPHARRLWPESLVSWTRLLSGRGKDPLVGRDVLVGLAAFHAFFVGTIVLVRLDASLGAAAGTAVRSSLAPLNETRFFLAALVDAPRTGIFLSLLFLVGLVLSRLAGEKRLASAVYFLVLFAFSASGFAMVAGGLRLLHVLLAGGYAAGWTLLATRGGLLSMAVVMSLFDFGVSVPVTLDAGVWWGDRSFLVVGILLVLAIWSARVASRGRPPVL